MYNISKRRDSSMIRKMKDKKFRQRGVRLNEIANIRNLMNSGQLSLALTKIEHYLKEYGEDSEVLYFYSKLLRKMGRVDEALETLEKILLYENQNDNVSGLVVKKEMFRLYFINDRYQEAYDLFENLKGTFPEMRASDEDTIEKILQIKLGMYNENSEETNHVINRLLHYDEAKAIIHIKEHLYEKEGEYHSVFANIDVEELMVQVKNALPTAHKLQTFSNTDVYLFYFDGIGKKHSNVLQVVTNKGTYEIISMYPTNKHYAGFINKQLYDDYVESEACKTKKISQIDKFKKRYNMK